MNFANKISSDDLDRVNAKNNPPDSIPGFEFDTEGLDSIFDGFDDSSFGDSPSSGGFVDSGFGGNSEGFGNSNSGGFGGNSGGFGNNSGGFGNNNGGFGGNSFGGGGFGQSSFGGNSFGGGGFGGNSFGGGGFGNNGFGQSSFGGMGGFGNNGFGQDGFGGMNQNNGQAALNNQKPDMVDTLIDTSIDTAKSLGKITIELFKSLSLRNVDDYGYLGRRLILFGCGLTPAGIVMGLIGFLTSIKFLSFSGMGSQLALAGALTLGTGLISIGTAALVLEKMGEREESVTLDEIPDPPMENNAINDFEENIGAETDDLFGDDFDDLFKDFDFSEDSSNGDDTTSNSFVIDDNEDGDDVVAVAFDPSKELENINENQYITREVLYNTFKPMFPFMTPDFAKRTQIYSNEDDYNAINTICLKALANITNSELEDIDTNIDTLYDSLFSYEIKLKRIRKKINNDAFARELEVYFREDSNDTKVNVTVSIEGDFYKIIVAKGETAVVTFGDIFKNKKNEEFFLNTKNKLPMISGIDALGNVILSDARNFDTMLIAGKPRSGKSWFVLSILSCLMLFNSPEDVQFIIYDPKESNLFKTLSLMPHVCGLHHEGILDVMDDLINVEAPRRKKIQTDHKVDDIWALRDKGIKVPILYLIIDEYITVRNDLGDASKDLDKKLQTIISQLPSLGIRLIFVPHRATGVVDKTNRTMIQFYACVKSDISEIKDTLDINSWNTPLTNPGDIAFKSTSNPNPLYVRGAALTPDDNTNTTLLTTAAKAFYKMGVDLPDMSAMTIACNRDNDYIRNELSDNTSRMQFNASTVLADIE